MPFQYKNKKTSSRFWLVFALISTFIALPLLFFGAFTVFLFSSVTKSKSPIGLFPSLGLPSLLLLIGLIVLIISIAKLKNSHYLIKGDDQGLAIHHSSRDYRFSWNDIESITYTRSKYPLQLSSPSPFSRMDRVGLLTRPFYTYLAINTKTQPAIQIEVTYIDGDLNMLLQQLQSFTPNVRVEDLN